MEIKSVFGYDLSSDYSCFTNQAFITKKNQVLPEFEGTHTEGKGHKDVQQVYFENTKVKYFPRDLQKHFPNMTKLIMFNCGLKEISKNDLKGFEGLVEIRIIKCELTSLPDDLLTEMPYLRTVSFEGNKIEIASSEVLKPLLGRENVEVDLRENKNIDDCFWPRDTSSLKSLEELMKMIDEKCIKPPLPAAPNDMDFNPKIKEMWLSERFSDLTIIAGDNQFKVHKNILGIRSEVFAQILEQSDAAEIKISDFSSKSVEALLKFIYSNEVSDDGNAKEIFEIANKFKVADMKTIYEEIISNQIDEENIWETFMFAHRFSSKQLKEIAFQLIKKKIPETLPHELMEDPENLKTIFDVWRVYEKSLTK